MCTGTEFLLLDNGMSPEKHGATRLLRRELAYVRYETQGLFNTKQPRVLHVAVPAVFSVNCSTSCGSSSSTGSGSGEAAALELETAECRPLTHKESLQTRLSAGHTDGILVCEKKSLFSTILIVYHSIYM